MINISLTTFVDYAIKSGNPRITVVKNALKQYGVDYDPNHDYWKFLRDAIIEMHKHDKDKSHLDLVASRILNPNKKALYGECVQSYKKWMRNRQITWFPVPRRDWVYHDLKVSVNPELGLKINDDNHVVKLYFRKEKISKQKVDTILYLLSSLVPAGKSYIPGILDVQNGKLITPTREIAGIDALLESEAEGFVSLWNKLK